MENSIEFFLNTHLEWSLSHQGFVITLEPVQSYIFMWCRILQEEGSLNIEINKHFKQLRFLRSRHISQNGLPYQVDIKFNDLWDHLASETQQEYHDLAKWLSHSFLIWTYYTRKEYRKVSHDKCGKVVHRPCSSCISSVQELNRNSIEFFLSTQT